MKLAEKFSRPVLAFIDTPAAYPGMESEERGISEAIALNLREMVVLDTPIVVVVHGEGGSGGALGIAVGDRILMHEFAIYSVIPPEGCAAILWRDAGGRSRRRRRSKLTAPDLLRLGMVDEIVPEPRRRRAHQSRAGRDAARHVAVDGAVREVTAMELGEPAGRALSQVARDGRTARHGRGADDAAHLAARAVRRAAGAGAGARARHRARDARACCASAASAIRDARAASWHPSLDDLHDPFALADMARGGGADPRRDRAAERIAMHGDYDVDGVTSTVILRRALELLGADVTHFIPERLRDGYGLQPASLDRLHADGVRWSISVDCGIRGVEAARRARELGLDLIITDHHEPDAELPCALAVDQSRSATTAAIPTRTWPASAWR